MLVPNEEEFSRRCTQGRPGSAGGLGGVEPNRMQVWFSPGRVGVVFEEIWGLGKDPRNSN